MVLGRERSATESGVFRRLSLVALLAWVGLGSDGISSSCYGPEEAFLALGGHHYLALILAAMTAFTVLVISASYMQIIEAFPTGGGAYVVASKFLSPGVGMVAGSALVVDYVLTITISIASGADAVFSLLPMEWHEYKLAATFLVLASLTILNMRGVKESVVPLVPIFIAFLLTHAAAILFALGSHLSDFPTVVENTTRDLRASVNQLGLVGVCFLLLHAYSLGGGTYTGIEAVSNGLPLLREPRVETGRRTMIYMAASLAFIAGGLILGYLLYRIEPEAGKTLNAVLFDAVARDGLGGHAFAVVALFSEAMILLVAAQTGFLDGPRVLANMALDGWMPNRFSLLSDRLVTQNGILLMGAASAGLLWISKGAVEFLVVLYSINVFLVFSLSQLGMVRHWWKERRDAKGWRSKLLMNGLGLVLTGFILLTVVVIKFHEGGWLTLVVTSLVVALAVLVKRHYFRTRRLLGRLDALVTADIARPAKITRVGSPHGSSGTTPADHTAVILVSGFQGLGLHTLFSIIRLFPGHFTNFVFIEVGLIDAGRFKGSSEIENLRQSLREDLTRYEDLMRSHGYSATGLYGLGTDVTDEVEQLATQVVGTFPNSVLFAGQLVFPRDTWVTRILHNYTAFAVQRRLYHLGIPVVILPCRM